jgi:septum site-determining protein MinC
MAKGMRQTLLAEGHVTLLRGRREGLELALAGRELGEAFEELEARLAERPTFYQGTSAVANFGSTQPSSSELARLRSVLGAAGIELRALSGPPALEELARGEGLAFEAASSRSGELERRRVLQPRTPVQLSESARSLVADFAGARDDIAQRRKRGDASVRRPKLDRMGPTAEAPALHLVDAQPSTYYNAGTLRGGQALHHVGNIVIVGDVNPGAELVATGDILVFGRLSGIAHAGARGDEGARIYAIALDATQLRIATFIAAESDASRPRASGPEAALVRDGRIVILSLDRLGQLARFKAEVPKS